MSDWAAALGTKIGQALKNVKALDGVRAAGAKAVHAYGEYMSPEQAAQRSQSIPAPMRAMEKAYNERAHPNLVTERQDAEIQSRADAIADATDMKNAAMAKARDASFGLPVAPQHGVRQPEHQYREFPSNPAGQADQDAYITKIREALKNAKQ